MQQTQHKAWQKFIGLFLILLFLGSLGFVVYKLFHPDSSPSPSATVLQNVDSSPIAEPSPQETSGTSQTESTQTPSTTLTPTQKTEVPDQEKLPRSKTIKVPFLVQAPHANWDALHEEACEEASLIMLNHYIKGTSIGSIDDGEKEIQELVTYEGENGYGISIPLEQLQKIANDYYGLTNSHLKTDVSVEALKREIVSNRPIIIPAAGKILPNPNFRNGGPLYHMLVIVGYDNNEFITNDPGTRKGKGFKYKYDDLIRAIHDWNGGDVINGQKVYMVFGG